jgi:hypothetical protein
MKTEGLDPPKLPGIAPVDPFPRSPTHDPDLDSPRQMAVLEPEPPLLPQEFQRLIANPFLALFGLVIWFQAFRYALWLRNLMLVSVIFLALAAVGYLLHYHCLDCGATGLLFRWKSHACPTVRARQLSNQVRRFRGPAPTMQLMLWMYALAGIGILVFLGLRTAGP